MSTLSAKASTSTVVTAMQKKPPTIVSGSSDDRGGKSKVVRKILARRFGVDRDRNPSCCRLDVSEAVMHGDSYNEDVRDPPDTVSAHDRSVDLPGVEEHFHWRAR